MASLIYSCVSGFIILHFACNREKGLFCLILCVYLIILSVTFERIDERRPTVCPIRTQPTASRTGRSITEQHMLLLYCVHFTSLNKNPRHTYTPTHDSCTSKMFKTTLGLALCVCARVCVRSCTLPLHSSSSRSAGLARSSLRRASKAPRRRSPTAAASGCRCHARSHRPAPGAVPL